MKKSLLVFLIATLLPTIASAVVLTPEQALKRAGKTGVATRSISEADVKLVYTATTATDMPTVYVFDNTSTDGFMFISADDVAIPVLGYADSGSFDSDDLSPELKWWLSEYSRQIEYAAQNSVISEPAATIKTRALGGAIAPMIRTKWNQDSPYNNDCPVYGSKRSVTGCVATAMAQVMNYWRYPAVGTGSIEYEAQKIKQTLSMNFSEHPFDWSNMLNEYNEGEYSTIQAKAVANLMVVCGYSVEMNYSPSESGAGSANIAKALVENFGYNSNITYQQRDYYSASVWNEMVYSELKAGRPVLYAGSSLTGAHQFVCDGYDGNGYFHINWGWGGVSDGYFTLDALTPGSQGIGGSSGGYNYGQSILMGVQKDLSKEAYSGFLLDGGLLASRQGIQVTVQLTNDGWLLNSSFKTISGTVGFIIEPESGGTKYFKESRSLSLDYGRGYPGYKDNSVYITFPFYFPNETGMKDGNYKVTFACKYDGTTEWFPIPASIGYTNYFIVKKSGGDISIVNQGEKLFSVTGNVKSEIIKGFPVKFSITAKNNTDMELSEGVYPALVKNDVIYYAAEGFMLTLKPGEEATKEWSAPFTIMGGNTEITSDTQFTLKFYNPGNGLFYDVQEAVTMKVNEGTISAAISGIQVVGAKKQFITLNDDSTRGNPGYVVGDPNNIEFSYTIKNTGTAYFGYPIYIFIFPYQSGEVSSIQGGVVGESAILQPNEIRAETGKFNFTAFENNKAYFTNFYYLKDGKLEKFENSQVIFKIDTSGIGGIYDDSSGSLQISYNKQIGFLSVISQETIRDVRIYSVNGDNVSAPVKCSGNNAEASLDSLVPGVYVIVASDASGAKKTIKILR